MTLPTTSWTDESPANTLWADEALGPIYLLTEAGGLILTEGGSPLLLEGLSTTWTGETLDTTSWTDE